MRRVELLNRVAETDATFERRAGDWVGRCLLCNGSMAFDSRTGEGATLEHIRARSRGGTDALENLAITHPGCNWEKGRRWDPRRRRNEQDYEEFVAKLLMKRADRLRLTAGGK
jgi:5-methylcytosine-specific restriction endonuclease McrA